MGGLAFWASTIRPIAIIAWMSGHAVRAQGAIAFFIAEQNVIIRASLPSGAIIVI
jgi:hypothetical protein